MQLGKVHSVDDVAAALLTGKAPSLLVSAAGRAASSGWSNAQLAQYIHISPLADGVQAFDFVAQRPPIGSAVLPVLTPIRAETVIPNADVDNYWGPGQPLRGVRIYAVANAKTALFDEPTGMHALASRGVAPAAACQPTEPNGVPSFAADIKPLFRPRDVLVMEAIAGWRLDNYDDVKANAAKIHARLANGTMPCDGAWPQADIDLFGEWMAAEMPA
jgi:hypothetical protein